MIPGRSASEPVFVLKEVLGKKGLNFLSLVRLRDPYTGGHCNRVRLLAQRICEELALSPTETANIVMGSCLHDMGKIAIPGAILRKPASLTADEQAIMSAHPIQGWMILKEVDGFSEVAEIVRHHHERYDGSGYPDQLCGEQISVGARIVAVLDAYDAMASGRCYQKAMSKNRVLSELIKGKGSQFDPTLIDVLIPILSRMNLLPSVSDANRKLESAVHGRGSKSTAFKNPPKSFEPRPFCRVKSI
jgi:HD-GYP domain-containing protein (c-di-GMP phosphodiesterase class II)